MVAPLDPEPGPAPREETHLVDAVRDAVVRHRLLAPGDRVLVAVSGGPDSIALLDVLTRLRALYGLELAVCHVHHGLRPDADRDAEFVRNLATRFGCPVTVEQVAVRHRAGRSPESAARTARYAALERAGRAWGATRIALGHTADDQAETVLMRVLQGAGPRGLGGIPIRRGRLIRPLLELERAVVLAHLEARTLPWVEDPTNQDPKMLRNRIRHEILPLLAAHGWPRIKDALRRTARTSRETVEALESLLAPRIAGLARPVPGGLAVDLAAMAGLPPGAVKTLLRRVILDVGGGAPGAERLSGLRAHHLEALHGLLGAAVGARVRLPGGCVVERVRDGLWVTAPAGRALGRVELRVPGETSVPGRGLRLVAEAGPIGEGRLLDPASEVWFDAMALPPRPPTILAVRAARPGDRLVPFGEAHPVRVATLLARAGTPRPARTGWPLLVAPLGEGGAAGDVVLWVIGVRRAAAAPVTDDTTVVLRVRAVRDPQPVPMEDAP
ncbi:MAG TPA: tRNA lysidine(34) synthetase TilS [Methylomirabilota bacterium]|nr:tRNA lysidine(34) synthetase TilS [Methylomirabilota bacterium]